jgi:hypothetical protein
MGCITQNVITMHLGLPDARYATPYSTFGSNHILRERKIWFI